MAVEFITLPTLAASGSRGLHVASDMAYQMNGKGGRPAMTFQTASSLDQGSKGGGGGGSCSPSPNPPHTHTHTQTDLLSVL